MRRTPVARAAGSPSKRSIAGISGGQNLQEPRPKHAATEGEHISKPPSRAVPVVLE